MPKNPNSNPNTGNQGFASMDPEKVRQIAAKGGRSSHSGSGGNNASEQQSKSHSSSKGGHASSGSFEKGSERARQAGRKGGRRSGGTQSNQSNEGIEDDYDEAAEDEDYVDEEE